MRVEGILIPPVIVAIWCGVVFTVWRRTAPEERPRLIGIFVACVVIGAAIFFLPPRKARSQPSR
jgi:hypothetical protein